MSSRAAAQFPVNQLILGNIGAAYGIHGWLKVFSSTEEAESIFNYQPWFIQRLCKWQKVELESWKYHNRDIIVKIKGIQDRFAASQLTNCQITVDSKQLLSLEEGDYYWNDLIGCQVVNLEYYEMGKVIDLIETGSNDVLVVKAPLNDAFGMQKRLIPFLDEQVIKKIDLSTGTMRVDWSPDF